MHITGIGRLKLSVASGPGSGRKCSPTGIIHIGSKRKLLKSIKIFKQPALRFLAGDHLVTLIRHKNQMSRILFTPQLSDIEYFIQVLHTFYDS